MHVVIGGAGEVGRHITQALRRDGHDVVILDVDPQACEEARGLDCMVIEGHAASRTDLKAAKIEDADVFYAVTSEDEVNLAAAAVAKSEGAEHVFARVNSLDLMEEAESGAFTSIGVDRAVSPDLVAAEKLRRMIELPGILEVDAFDVGNLRVVETRIEPGSPAAGRQVRELDLPEGVNLVAAFRGAEVLVPRGPDALYEGDRAVLVVAGGDEGLVEAITRTFGERANVHEHRGPPEHVVVTGDSGCSRRLARMLEKSGHRVTMVAEANQREQIEELAAEMEGILVIEGSSRDVRVFRDEELDAADAIVAASPHEEFNVITCLLAKSLGVPRTMALVDQPELEELGERIGVDAAVSPRLAAVSTLLKYASELDPEELTLLQGGEAQVLLVQIEPDDPVAGKLIKDAGLPRSSVVGAIVRDGETIVPRGNDRLKVGDRVVVFATSNVVSELTELL